MKSEVPKTTSGPIKVLKGKRLKKINTEGAFQEKLEKAAYILKTVGLPKGIKL